MHHHNHNNDHAVAERRALANHDMQSQAAEHNSAELVRESHLQHGCNGALFGWPSAASTETRGATASREVEVSHYSGSPGHVLHRAAQKHEPLPPIHTHHTQDGGGGGGVQSRPLYSMSNVSIPEMSNKPGGNRFSVS